MSRPIQPVQVAPANPSQVVPVPARALPPQPLASNSSLQSLSSSEKGCLRRTWDYFISILESIYAYCFCRRSSTPPPAVNPPAPSAIPSSNPVNLEQRAQAVQGPQALVSPEVVAENSEVSDVGMDSADEGQRPMPTLRETQALVMQLYNELIPDRLEELVASDRWEEIETTVRRLEDRASHSQLTKLLDQNMDKLKQLLVAAREWKRHLYQDRLTSTKI